MPPQHGVTPGAPLISLFLQDIQSHRTISLHTTHQYPLASSLAQMFSKRVLKAMMGHSEGTSGISGIGGQTDANWDPLAPNSTLQIHKYTCHYIVLGEIFIVAVCDPGSSTILEASRALEHAKYLVMESLGNSLKNVTMQGVLQWPNYAQIVLALDELVHQTNLHHVPKREMEWISSGNRVVYGGSHMVMGSLVPGAAANNSDFAAPLNHNRRHQMRTRRATKIRLEDSEIVNMGLNWKLESKMVKEEDERLKQLRGFSSVSMMGGSMTRTNAPAPITQPAPQYEFDNSWAAPDDSAHVESLHHDKNPLRHQKSGLDNSLNTAAAAVGITSQQFDRLTKSSLDQLEQNAISPGELENIGGDGALNAPRKFNAEDYGVDANANHSNLQSPHTPQQQQQQQRDSTKLNNFDLLKLDGSMTHTPQGSDTQTFSDDDTSTVGSLRMSTSVDDMREGDHSGAPSSPSTLSPIPGNMSSQASAAAASTPTRTPTTPRNTTTNTKLPLIINFNETIRCSYKATKLDSFSMFGEISAQLTQPSTQTENFRFTLLFPSSSFIEQFLPNTKVCRPAKNKTLTYNCSIPQAILSKQKSVPLLRYKMKPSFQVVPVKLMVRRQVNKNLSRIMIDYALNPKMRPDMISLMIDPLPSQAENQEVRVTEKPKFKPESDGIWNGEKQQLLFKIRTTSDGDDDSKLRDKIIAQFTCNQNLEQLSENLEEKPLLVKYLLKRRSVLLERSEGQVEAKILGSDSFHELGDIFEQVKEMIQGNAKML